MVAEHIAILANYNVTVPETALAVSAALTESNGDADTLFLRLVAQLRDFGAICINRCFHVGSERCAVVHRGQGTCMEWKPGNEDF